MVNIKYSLQPLVFLFMIGLSLIQPTKIMATNLPSNMTGKGYEVYYTVQPDGSKYFKPQFTGTTSTGQQVPMTQESYQKTYPEQPAPTQTNYVAPSFNASTAGITERDAWARSQGYTGWNNYQDIQAENARKQAGPSDADLNAVYNPVMDYYNQAESMLRADYPTVQKEAESQYTTNRGLLDTKQKEGLANLDLTAQKGQAQKEDALASARRLYGELSQANQARFGGSSSAGQAASELQSVEQQRQMGQTNRQANEFMQQIETQKNTINNEYQNGLLQLEQQKQTALNQAQRDFQQKLLDISNSRAQTESAKAQAKLQALQELRNQAYQIQLQNTQFQQALEAQRQQSALAVQQYQQMYGGAINNASTAYNQLTTNTTQNPTSQYGLMGTNQTTTSPQYIGAIGGGLKDIYGNPI